MAEDFNLEQLDPSSPSLFYFKHGDMAPFADDTWLVQGVRLPVHSHVLILHSPVLRGAYSTLRESRSIGGTNPAQGPEAGGTAASSALLEGYTVQEVALLLRFLYHPYKLTAANLSKVREHLPALLRLAHRLDVQLVLSAVQQELLQPITSGTCSMGDIASCISLADELQLDDLLAEVLPKALSRLASGKSGANSNACYGAAFDALQLSSLKGSTHQVALAALVFAIRSASSDARNAILGGMPSTPTIAGWLGLTHSTGSYTWEVANFSQLGGRRVESPHFQIDGHTWSFRLYPHGRAEGAGSHISFRVGHKAPASAEPFAMFRLTLVSQGAEDFTATSYASKFKSKTTWGFNTLIKRAEVIDPARGFLMNDTLTVKVDLLC